MSGLAGAPVGASGVEHDDHRNVAYLIIGGLAVLLVAMVFVTVTSLTAGDNAPAAQDDARAAQLRKLPVHWTVRRGDSYVRIAQRTGLTVAELETFNPNVDPSAIQPGQKLKLRANVPKAKPKPVGPRSVTVRAGESFGSIAADTGESITRLRQLNPKLEPSALQPGDRVRLR